VDRVSLGFRERCYALIRKIPEGKLMTYGDIALAIGKPGAARAVGTAMRLNPDAPKTPCHRVVPSTGEVGNYSGSTGVAGKIALLRKEGIRVVNGRVKDFHLVRWRP
jgi:methylated-DNA-[protein]-cysteine S-methyltransferase